MSPHSTRNTSIRTRKIRGEDSLLSSISIAEREEGPAGITMSSIARSCCSSPQYGTAVPGKKASRGAFAAGLGELHAQPGSDDEDDLYNFHAPERHSAFFCSDAGGRAVAVESQACLFFLLPFRK